tara:strand:+ start:313 stop:537 length:225 start_codon:yes stop_codon:yes gene_type:complete
MAYGMKRGAAPKYKELGSSPTKDVDMEKLRSKQARMSKGISEFQYFADPKSQGDEPKVEHTWVKGYKGPKKKEK